MMNRQAEPAPLEKRRMSIRTALEWAFGTEFAWLSLDETDVERQVGVDTVYRLMERHKLGGMHIQGGGRSDPHHDADIIAAAVTDLALNGGDYGMALTIAELSRMGKVPDWMEGAVPQIEPMEWKKKGGFSKDPMGAEEVLQKHTLYERRPVPRKPGTYGTYRRVISVKWVPIRWTVHPREIKRARRKYLAWADALEGLRGKLATDGNLETIELTNKLPVRRPWARSPVADHQEAGVNPSP